MSAAPTYLLFCDSPDCEETFLAAEALTKKTTPPRLAQVRKSAAELGWTAQTVEPDAKHQFARTVDACTLCSRRAVR